MLAGKKIAILVAPNFHDEEATVPFEFFTEKGARVDFVGLDASEITGKYGRKTIKPDKTIDQVSAHDYDALIIPGGGAPERIRVVNEAVDFVKDFWNTGRPIAAICHGPQVLISAGVLKGVTLTCYAGIRDDVLNAGATYVDQQVCIDGQLITSRTPDDLPAFNEALLKALTSGFLSDEEKEMEALKALQLAVAREKGAREFYLGVSGTIQKESIKNKFKYLADVEQDHFDQLSQLYVKISGGKQPVINEKDSEIGKNLVSPEITAEEALKLAMEAEQRAYEFYRNAALKARSERAREMFEYLAAEELEHKRLLSIDAATTPGGGRHFQWATFWDIPPGMDDLW